METKEDKALKGAAYFFAGALAVVVALGGYFAYGRRAESLARAQAHVLAWRDGPRLTAQIMLERYGPPDALAPGLATWHERGPWKRITVHGDAPLSYLEQAVGYRVPPGAAGRLSEFDHGLRFDLDKEELSATSNMEAVNILALNVADELATGRRGADDAGNFYLRTARLAASGKSSPYLEKLRFEPYRPQPQRPWNREIGY